MTQRQTRRARMWLASAAIMALPGVAMAQTGTAPAPAEAPAANPAANPAAAQDIVVTGSRIKGARPVGSPLIGLNRDDLTQIDPVSTTQLVQDLPQIVNQGVSENSRATSGGAGNITYASGFNIHGIGPYATLTLMNGHRLVQSGASGGLPDPDDIPTIAIQRVDVVADGASAIYGSDAVAGVVNLVTRRRFDGFETQVHEGVAGAYDEQNYGAIAGHSWSTGNITAAVEYSGHSNLSGNDRSFYTGNLTAQGGGNYLSNQCNPGNVLIGATSYALPGLAAGTSNSCDNLKSTDLIPEQQRITAMLSLTQEVGSRLTLTFDGLYSHRSFLFRAGQTSANLTVPNTNAYYTLPAGVAASSETVAYSFAGEVPPNDSWGASNTFQLNLGAAWKAFADWEIDADGSYGHDFSFSQSVRGINNGALAAALASSNPATALNPYSSTNNASVLSGIFNSEFYAPGTNKEAVGTLSGTGSLFRLPGGKVRLAVGGEIDYSSILTGFDSGSPGAVGSLRTFASRTVSSGFGELLVPIFGPGNAIPGIQRLELSLAGRISHYSDVGTSTNPKVGVNWDPTRGLTIHGSYGTSFRAPNLTQIYGAVSGLFVQNYQTPSGIVQGVALSGFPNGNPLSPERARTFSAGADWSPPQVPGLKLSADYFNVKYTGQINSILANLTFLQSAASAAQYASRVVTGASAAATVQQYVADGYPVFGVLPANPTLFVYGNNVNSGITYTQGIDFQASYHRGEFTVGTNGTVFTQYKYAVSPTAPLLDELNNIFYPPAFRMRNTFRWSHHDIDAGVYVNYTGPYNNNQVSPIQRVGSYTTVDLHLAYTFHDVQIPLAHGLTVAFDMTNLFNANPPFVNIAESSNGGGGFDPTVTNPIGRLAAFTLSTKL